MKQLLAKMDGVDTGDNFLVCALTLLALKLQAPLKICALKLLDTGDNFLVCALKLLALKLPVYTPLGY